MKIEEKTFRHKGSLIPFLKRILQYALNYPKWFWLFMAFMAVVAVVEALYPVVWLLLIDNVVIPSYAEYQVAVENGETYSADFRRLLPYLYTFLSLGLIQVIAVHLFIRFAGYLENYIMFDLRKDIFDKLQDLSYSFYDRSASGWLLSRITSDTGRVTEVITWGLVEAVWGTVMIIACLTAMFFINWQLAFIVLAIIPLLILISFRIRRLILLYSRASRKLNSELTASYNEHINGVEVNKSTAQEERVSREFNEQSGQMRKASYRASYFTALYMPMVIATGSAAAVAVLYFGSAMAIQVPAAITVGALAAFFAYATRIFEPIFDISRFYAMAQGAISAGERIFSLLDTKSEISNTENAKELQAFKGEIFFRNLSFGYEPGSPIFENLNLKLEAGQSVALVGETGGGKSSLIHLLCRFYEPISGQILFDGVDYKEYSLESIRKQLGIVLQVPHLFTGTIRDNLTLGRKQISDDKILIALKQIGADQFTNMLDTRVGTGGTQLSIGEQQLIAMARALLKDPSVFILDEATANIDGLTEAKLQKGIHNLMKGRTSIIIAHRLSTIRSCDRIIVIRNGKIEEDGTHRQLLANKAYYHLLYKRQLQDKLE